MTTALLIGNGISFAAAIMTILSSLAKDRWHIYIYQVAQCLLSAIASIFFNSYAGVVSLLVCAARNYLSAIDKLGKRETILCAAAVLVLGIACNNRGAIGWIVIAANVIYTIGSYAAKREKAIKANIVVNLTLWIVYEAFIFDIPSIIADGAGLGAAVWAMVRGKKKTAEKM